MKHGRRLPKQVGHVRIGAVSAESFAHMKAEILDAFFPCHFCDEGEEPL
jgi:hypothetical protein